MDPLLAKLTLAIPVYNEGRFLREAIGSCLGQAGQILLCDNASDDGSSEICAEFAANHPEVTHIRRERNIGAFNNFKEPLIGCSTEYFCWIGGHDRIAADYTLHLVRRLEDNPTFALAAGTIQHMDEEGRLLKGPIRSVFLDARKQPAPLDRIEALAWHLRDCFVFHGVYRTEILKQAWFDQPCLGFDRILLFRVGAIGRMDYVPEALLHARDFPAMRKIKQDKKRRSEILTEKGASPMTNFERNFHLAQTTLSLAHDDASLSRAFRIIQKIRSRHHERRRYRKIHILFAALALFLLSLLVTLAIY